MFTCLLQGLYFEKLLKMPPSSVVGLIFILFYLSIFSAKGYSKNEFSACNGIMWKLKKKIFSSGLKVDITRIS